MTKEEMTGVFANLTRNDKSQGVVFYIPKISKFVSAQFGSEDDVKCLSEEFNGCVMISVYEFNGYSFEEVESGKLDFFTESEVFGANIGNLIYDALGAVFSEKFIKALDMVVPLMSFNN